MKKRMRLTALLMALMMVFSTFAGASAAEPAAAAAVLTEIQAEAFAGIGLLQGLVELPDGLETVGSDAFADSGIFALSVPASVEKLADQSNQEMAYVYFHGSHTQPEGQTGAHYVIGAQGSPAESWAESIGAGFVDVKTLVQHAGFYYQVNNGEAVLLCAVNNVSVPENVTIPASVAGAGVKALSAYAFDGCSQVKVINVIGGADEMEGCFEGAPNASISRYQKEPELKVTIKGGIVVNSQRQLEYAFEDGYTNTVDFASSNESVLTIDENGMMTGVSVGTAVITLTTPAGQTVQHTIWVTSKPQPVIVMQPSAELEPGWYCKIPVTLQNVGYLTSPLTLSCTAEFLDGQGNEVLKWENAASLQMPIVYETEATIEFYSQLWARAYQAGARKLRVVLCPAEGSDVLIDEQYGAVTIDLPQTHPYPIVLVEYSQAVLPNGQFTLTATCLNPETMKEYRPVALCDLSGTQLTACYIGTYHPSGEVWQNVVGMEAPQYLLQYPGADSANSTYTDYISTIMSYLTGVEGTDGITLGVGDTCTVQCAYVGSLPPITCSSWNTGVATAQVNGGTVTITGISTGTAYINVTDGYQSFLIPVTVEAGRIDGIFNGTQTVDSSTPVKLGTGETCTLECTYTGRVPNVTCTSWDSNVAAVQANGTTITVTAVGQGNTSIVISDGYQSFSIPVAVENGRITDFSRIDRMLLYIGETGSLMFSYEGNPQITCTSYNENVATAERDGNFIRVTGVAAGQTTIAVDDGSGGYYYVTVNVIIDPNGTPVLLGFNGGLDANLKVAEILPLWIQCSNSNVAPAGLTYTSSNENVVKVLSQEKWSVSILGINPGTAQLTASDGQNSFTINVNVTGQMPPVLYLDMDSDGQTLDMALPYEIKVRTSTPADQFVMPSVILADWEFLAADGSVVYTTSVTHNPLDEPVLEDNTITLSHHFGTMIYQIGASTARVKLGQSPTMFSEYIVSQPEQYLTFHIPDINTAYVTVFSVNSDAPIMENRTVLVENGTNVTLTLECLNPWLLKGDIRSVFWEKNGEEKTRLGEVSQAEPSLTFAVPALQDELVRYKFIIEWPPYWPEGGYDSCEIEIQYGLPYEYEPFDLNDMAVDVGKTAVVPVYNQNFNRPQDLSWTIEDENIALVENGIVTGIAPGETTLTVRYGPIVRTAKVRVYDSDVLQTGELSLAQDQSVWPWVRQDLFTTPWHVKVTAGQSAQLTGAASRIYFSVAFKDAQDNVIQTYNMSTETRFHLPNEATGDVYLETLMLNKLASAGVVKATVRIEAVTGGLSINEQGRSVDILMDSLYNYPDDGMLYVEHSNPYEVKLGDKLTFTVKAGNRTVNKDCTLLLGYSGQHYTTGDFFDEVLVPVTFNPSQIGEQTVTFDTNQYAGYHLRVAFYNHDRSFQLGDYSAVVSAN